MWQVGYDYYYRKTLVKDAEGQSIGMAASLHPDAELNARLFAASPDLLRACILLLNPALGTRNERETFARDAIAKARGEIKGETGNYITPLESL